MLGGRLFGVVSSPPPDWTTTEQSWTYDAIGNRLAQTAAGTTTSYSYVKNGTNPNNSARLTMAGPNAVSHDVSGNMTAYSNITYTWDTLDRLKTRSAAGLTYTFSYDAQDRRTGIDHQSTKFIYQGLNAVDMSYRKDGGYHRSNYLFGPGIDEPLARVDSTQVTYYSVDGLGSVILLTDGVGTVKNKYSYDAWGEKQTRTETLVQPFRYTSRESLLLDGSVSENLYYYRARHMMPGIGRFLSEDPLRPLTGIYIYANNNAVLLIDPLGLDAGGADRRANPGQIACINKVAGWYASDRRLCNLSREPVRNVAAAATLQKCLRTNPAAYRRCLDAYQR